MGLFFAVLDPSAAGYSYFQQLSPIPSWVFFVLLGVTVVMAIVTARYPTLPDTPALLHPPWYPEPFFQQACSRRCVSWCCGAQRLACVYGGVNRLKLSCTVSRYWLFVVWFGAQMARVAFILGSTPAQLSFGEFGVSTTADDRRFAGVVLPITSFVACIFAGYINAATEIETTLMFSMLLGVTNDAIRVISSSLSWWKFGLVAFAAYRGFIFAFVAGFLLREYGYVLVWEDWQVGIAPVSRMFHVRHGIGIPTTRVAGTGSLGAVWAWLLSCLFLAACFSTSSCSSPSPSPRLQWHPRSRH